MINVTDNINRKFTNLEKIVSNDIRDNVNTDIVVISQRKIQPSIKSSIYNIVSEMEHRLSFKIKMESQKKFWR